MAVRTQSSAPAIIETDVPARFTVFRTSIRKIHRQSIDCGLWGLVMHEPSPSRCGWHRGGLLDQVTERDHGTRRRQASHTLRY